MSVYVDYPDRGKPFKFGKGRSGYPCHLIADTSEELVKIAKELKLNPDWIQCANTPKEHYDITSRNRKIAVDKFGALQITTREMVKIIQSKRQHHENGMDSIC